jgi:hypothetical protein
MGVGNIQSTYSNIVALSVPGGRYGDEGLYMSKAAQGAVTYGVAVKRGTDVEVQAVAGAGLTFIGFAAHTLAQEAAYSDATIGIGDTEIFDVFAGDGLIWLSPSNAVAAGDALKITTATGVPKGGAGVTGDTALAGAYWYSSCGAAGLALAMVPMAPVVSLVP